MKAKILYFLLLLALPSMLTAQYTGGFYGGVTSATLSNSPLPVQLCSFTSSVSDRDVTLRWQTTNEVNNYGFDIERKPENCNWEKVGFVKGSGTVTTSSNYTFSDKNLNTGSYSYRLKQTDFNGNYEYHSLSNTIEIQTPKKYEISRCYPNPSNPVVNINYKLPEASNVTIKIYDILGREMKTLINEIQNAGYYTTKFDGSSYSSGIYYFGISTKSNSNNFYRTEKFILIK